MKPGRPKGKKKTKMGEDGSFPPFFSIVFSEKQFKKISASSLPSITPMSRARRGGSRRCSS